MFYSWKIRLLKNRRFNLIWRYWRSWRGDDVGDYGRLPDLIREYAPDRSFADVGCMWGVNGEYSFIAEQAGATKIKAIDVFGPTPEYEAKKKSLNSKVEFILGDCTNSETISRIGIADVVFCAGVLYHHPSPFDLLLALRRICGQTLILRTSTIPEIKCLPNAAIYYPMLKAKDRRLWNLSSLGVNCQIGISEAFDPKKGYGNWFWGLTPSCLKSLLKTAGFNIVHQKPEAFAQTFICSAGEIPFEFKLPSEQDARHIGREISLKGIARPA